MVGLAAGVPGGLLLILLIVLLNWWIANRGKRDMTHAVTDPEKPFVLVFTDVQSSTSLWAASPETMGPALDLHNEILKRVAVKNKLFPVKWIGDSLMAVCKRPEDALQFAHDVQVELLNADWDNVIDDLYAKFIAEGNLYAGADEQLKRLRLDRTLFTGMCVRIGMHWAKADIRSDPENDAIDYFGIGVSTAARIESCGHGGQMLASADFMNAIQDKSSSSTASSSRPTSASRCCAASPSHWSSSSSTRPASAAAASRRCASTRARTRPWSSMLEERLLHRGTRAARRSAVLAVTRHQVAARSPAPARISVWRGRGQVRALRRHAVAP